MPRPGTKDDLLAAIDARYAELGALLASMTPEQMSATFAFEDRDRCVRDVLVHLHEWHLLLLRWVATNRAGEAAPFLPPPYNWRTYGGMNVEIRDRHRTTTLEQARSLLDESHAEARALIASLSNDELFTKKHFPWTGTTTLGSYCVSATSSHYEWAVTKLRRHLKTTSA